jgi:O-acetyl-ADP-ribose deacetylase (regulator of RNase III)
MVAGSTSDVLVFHCAARPGLRVSILRGDITRVETDAIVNAANPRMLGGGGVDGAIHRAAGPQLLKACRQLPEVRPGVRCPTGEARSTPGFDLPARYVIHTVGPVYHSAEQSAPLLDAAYRSCLRAATDLGVSSLAFPAISCGVYGYPLEEAASIALRTCTQTEHGISDIRFVLFDSEAFDAWSKAARRMLSD